MKQLNQDSLNSLQDNGVSVPEYRLNGHNPEIGIVHIGPGAFFRGHQSWYTHTAMQLAGGDWGISCVSMRSAGVSEALNPQDGLYTVAVLDADTSYEVVGSIQEVLIAKEQYQALQARLSSEKTKFVTMTITEKGYCLNSEGNLDLNNPDIKQDLSGEQQACSAIGVLVEALATRQKAGIAPFCAMSCDNLTDNGKKLRNALIQYAQQVDANLAIWLEDNLICPCSMVDSITPATDDALRQQVSEQLSITDNWPIKRESFVQWVVEDCLPADKPAWKEAGVTFTSDVAGFENAKLRLLNCPHSSMAYLGVLAEIETVNDAMQQAGLVKFIQKMIESEIVPSFTAPKELDVVAYSADILKRFRNPAIRHLLSQIAWDGSQKLPMRILPIIEQNIADGNPIESLSVAIAAWCLFIRKRYIEQEQLVDPLADKLLAIAAACTDDAEQDIAQFLSVKEVFGNKLSADKTFKTSLTQAYNKLLSVLQSKEIPWESLV
ncbi:mannitol dehydrogenase family protein [Paraglaciecola aquimarina]|uniref:Mannitol dehydrogenase family protein n=1 Tax=Paraglaciecola aquimarina TaxID=1235557 RepID=A0ABU3SYQ9_9ALTE|nr:mannitol dehydrogenase family protein [Paraglaciecola aquimarina]MDU0355144.1 mannitol dehydrogenase family protein [Paraglaciecola aquimarina]